MSALNRLKPATLAVTVVLAGSLLPVMQIQAQEVTILRGSPPSQPAAAIDCNNPYYFQYCQEYDAWASQYYSAPDYADLYPYYDYPYYYGYGLPAGAAIGFRFAHHHGNFHGGVHGGQFHGGGSHDGGSHGGGFHGGGHR